MCYVRYRCPRGARRTRAGVRESPGRGPQEVRAGTMERAGCAKALRQERAGGVGGAARNLGDQGKQRRCRLAKEAAGTAGVEEGDGDPRSQHLASSHRRSRVPPRRPQTWSRRNSPSMPRAPSPTQLLPLSWKHFPVGLWGAGGHCWGSVSTGGASRHSSSELPAGEASVSLVPVRQSGAGRLPAQVVSFW